MLWGGGMLSGRALALQACNLSHFWEKWQKFCNFPCVAYSENCLLLLCLGWASHAAGRGPDGVHQQVVTPAALGLTPPTYPQAPQGVLPAHTDSFLHGNRRPGPLAVLQGCSLSEDFQQLDFRAPKRRVCWERCQPGNWRFQ